MRVFDKDKGDNHRVRRASLADAETTGNPANPRVCQPPKLPDGTTRNLAITRSTKRDQS